MTRIRGNMVQYANLKRVCDLYQTIAERKYVFNKIFIKQIGTREINNVHNRLLSHTGFVVLIFD